MPDGVGMARDYEALVILKAAGTEQEMTRTASQLEESVKKLGGTVQGLQGMGRRRLAFRISRQTEGYYYLLRFRSTTDKVAELERRYRLNETIVRFMILSADDVSPETGGPGRRAGSTEEAGLPARA